MPQLTHVSSGFFFSCLFEMFIGIQLLKVILHLQLLQHIGCIPCVVQCFPVAYGTLKFVAPAPCPCIGPPLSSSLLGTTSLFSIYESASFSIFTSL